MALSLGISAATAKLIAEITATTALAASAISTVTGTTLGIVGSVAQQRQAEANAQMQEDQMNYNKRLAEREAAIQEEENREAVRRQREQDAALRAQQRALLGKSGAAMTAGSPLALLGETARNQELAVQDMQRTGYQQSQQSREQAKMFGYQAKVARAQAPSKTMLGLQIGSTISSGVKDLSKDFKDAAGLALK